MIENAKRRTQVFPNWCTHGPVGAGRKERTNPCSVRHWPLKDRGSRQGPWEPGALEAARGQPRVWNSWVTSWRMSKGGSRFYFLPSLHTQSYSRYFLRFLNLGTVALGGPTLLWGGAVPCVVERWAASSASTPETTKNVAKCVRGAHSLPSPVENHCVNWCHCFCCSFSLVFALASLCIVQLETPIYFKSPAVHLRFPLFHFRLGWARLRLRFVLLFRLPFTGMHVL